MTIIRSWYIFVSMRIDEEKMIKTLVVNGLYPRFKIYCTTHPDIRSRKRLCYFFLKSIGKWSSLSFMFDYNNRKFILEPFNVYDAAKVKWVD